jgi:hypothetical protein
MQVASVTVTRGKVRRVRLGPQRAVQQVAVFCGEVKEGVELLLPRGMSAVPLGGDVQLFQVNGLRPCLPPLGRLAMSPAAITDIRPYSTLPEMHESEVLHAISGEITPIHPRIQQIDVRMDRG